VGLWRLVFQAVVAAVGIVVNFVGLAATVDMMLFVVC